MRTSSTPSRRLAPLAAARPAGGARAPSSAGQQTEGGAGRIDGGTHRSPSSSASPVLRPARAASTYDPAATRTTAQSGCRNCRTARKYTCRRRTAMTADDPGWPLTCGDATPEGAHGYLSLTVSGLVRVGGSARSSLGASRAVAGSERCARGACSRFPALPSRWQARQPTGSRPRRL